MSNPYLRSNDPRFQRPSVTDGEGKNRFADGQPPPKDDGPRDQGLFTAGAATADKPYQPRYETTVESRGIFLLILSIGGIAGVSTGMTSLLGWTMGWIFPLLAVVLSATAWLLAYQDLQHMLTGAMDDSGKELTRAAMWLGFCGMIAAVGSVVTMIWVGLSVLPFFL